jgi:hypothetical protein
LPALVHNVLSEEGSALEANLVGEILCVVDLGLASEFRLFFVA